MDRALILLGKFPEPGRVKTRLCPPLSQELAAELYRCMLYDRFDQLRELKNAGIDLVFAYTPSSARFEDVPSCFTMLPQDGDDLGDVMSIAFERMFAAGYTSVALVDSDSVTLPMAYVSGAFDFLQDRSDLVIGPCLDGGWYLLGMREVQPYLFSMPWSSSTVCRRTIDVSRLHCLTVYILPIWYDIDKPDDLGLFYREAVNAKDLPRRTASFLMRHEIESALRSGKEADHNRGAGNARPTIS